MSIGDRAVADGPIASHSGLATKEKTPPRRQTVAKADSVEVPEAR